MRFFLLLFVVLVAVDARAIIYSDECAATAEFNHDEIPSTFSSSNNLTKKPESLFKATGEMIYVSGRIVDENCTPVAGALISIWHTNSKGYYQFTSLENADKENNDNEDYSEDKDESSIDMHSYSIEQKAKDDKYDEYFVGTGTAITDNMGYYNFITIKPGKFKNEDPLINFIVTHDDFSLFETAMYFATEKDSSLVAKKGEASNYIFDMVLKGENSYLRY